MKGRNLSVLANIRQYEEDDEDEDVLQVEALDVLLHTVKATCEGLIRGVTSVAVPMIGYGLGGLSWTDVRPLVVDALGNSYSFTG